MRSATTPFPSNATGYCPVGSWVIRPFNITTPRYDEYYRGILGFPQIVFSGGPAKKVPARAKVKKGGSPADYLAWVSEIGNPRGVSPSSSADMDYMAKVPFRSIGR